MYLAHGESLTTETGVAQTDDVQPSPKMKAQEKHDSNKNEDVLWVCLSTGISPGGSQIPFETLKWWTLRV